ncbi:MAG: hypothetical protein [Circular genetic element sp.]|nr:MAG: hypothetical protein [Circular genetic element sp.]
MARRKASKSKRMKIQPAVTDLTYRWTPATSDQGAANSRDQYIDVMRDLSIVNRRHYDQAHNVVLRGISFVYPAGTDPIAEPLFTLQAYSAGNTWSVQNAHVKGHALWNQMNQLVLDDNPSVQGKWAGFKVRLDDHMVAANTLSPEDGDESDYLQGEWEYSTYVLPQHSVDAAGNPLPALERTPHLVGADFGTRIGLVNAYQESRATVQPIDPSVPAQFQDSFFNILTDSGSQEPELADVIEDANDEPPYNHLNYPGGALNADCAVLHSQASVSPYSPDGMLGPLLLPCGLLRIRGTIISQPVTVILHVASGSYKGIAAEKMGQ